MRFALGLEYCGRQFVGWQRQSKGRTVQGELETALSRIAAMPLVVACAGRTDTGVHATTQVVHFDCDARRPVTAWVRGVNTWLPDDMVVRWCVPVDDGFHARYAATGRQYRYLLLNRPQRPGVLAGLVGWHHAPLDLPAMQEAAGMLIGRHDFSAFRAAQCQAKSPVRTLRSCQVTGCDDVVVFDLVADGFLHHMVRNIVGALVQVGQGRQPATWLESVLAGRNRTLAAPTFAAAGLYLCGITYDARWSLPYEGRIIALPRLP